MCFICDMDKRNNQQGSEALHTVSDAVRGAMKQAMDVLVGKHEARELELLTHVNALIGVIEQLNVNTQLTSVQRKQLSDAVALFGVFNGENCTTEMASELLDKAVERNVEFVKHIQSEPQQLTVEVRAVTPQEILQTLEDMLGLKPFNISKLDKSKH